MHHTIIFNVRLIYMASNSTNLIIVESPSKAKTLKRYLGEGYQIEASVGHIRDLPKSDLGVDVNNDFKATYVESEDKSKDNKNKTKIVNFWGNIRCKIYKKNITVRGVWSSWKNHASSC